MTQAPQISVPIDLNDFLSRWDMESVPDFDDKVCECEFFFDALSKETDRSKFRWLVSAFLGAAYSFFETAALTAHFRYTGQDGEPSLDHEGLAILRQHVEVKQRKNPNMVDTKGLSPITQQLYQFRNKNTHHFALSIQSIGPSLPEDFHFGSMRGEGTPVMPLCRDSLALIRKVYAEINA